MRISPKTIREARQISRLLPPLLRPTRSLEVATQELSWIKRELPKSAWKNAVLQRMNHTPLQYILGTQPFGDMDLITKPGVLIPRWETEEWAVKVLDFLISNSANNIRILDACTGTGCIPLLLNSQLQKAGIPHTIKAIDISPRAIEIANENSTKYSSTVEFEQQNLFTLKPEPFDLVTSNPPYIPMKDYLSTEVEKSVRRYEPKEALIGDLEFYTQLVHTVDDCDADNFIFELGYQTQAEHVKRLVSSEWTVGTLNDSAGNLRCVIGSKNMELNLTSLCNTIM